MKPDSSKSLHSGKPIVALVSILALVLFLSPGIQAQSDGDAAVISLDSTQQLIRGFGAANIVGWRPDMTADEVETAFGLEQGQLGFSILRLRVPPNQSEWPNYVPAAQAAYEMGVTIIASPWSPPASMKTNNSTVRGRLREDAYSDYAAHLEAFTEYMADNGIPLYAISVQNEPDVEVNYESCDWSPEEMTRFVKEYGDSVGTRLIAPESFQFRKPISDAILNDPEAAANLEIVGGHIYGGGLAPYPLAKEKGKELWMTEHLDTDISYDSVLATGKEIHDVMDAGMNAYIWWYIVRFYGPIHDGEDWNGDDIVDNTEKGEVTKRGYIMSHFSRFIRPGYYKLNTSSNPQSNIYFTAYKGDSRLILVALNMGSSESEQTFFVENGDITSFNQYVTNDTLNVRQGDNIVVTGNSFSASLPAKSITTFVSDQITVSNEEEVSVPDAYMLKQNYPNPFNPETTIHFVLPQTGNVKLKIFDVVGREIATLVDGRLSAGKHQVRFDASGFSSGIYMYRLTAGSFVQTRQMTLIK